MNPLLKMEFRPKELESPRLLSPEEEKLVVDTLADHFKKQKITMNTEKAHITAFVLERAARAPGNYGRTDILHDSDFAYAPLDSIF